MISLLLAYIDLLQDSFVCGVDRLRKGVDVLSVKMEAVRLGPGSPPSLDAATGVCDTLVADVS